LLLAIAVILPTVCLLWFMTQAAKNERFAIRQEVIEVYTKELEELRETFGGRWDKWRDFSHHTVKSTLSQQGHNCILFGNFLRVRLGDMTGMPKMAPFAGLIVYDSNGIIEYPLIDTNDSLEYELPEIFTQAWAFEFQNQQYPEAAEIYNTISKSGYNDYITRLAIVGHARCLQKQGKLSEALDICVKAHSNVSSGEENAELFEAVEQTKAASVPLIVQARIMYMSIRRQQYETTDTLPPRVEYYSYGRKMRDLWILASDDYSPLSRAMDAETRIYLLHKFIELGNDDFLRNTKKENHFVLIDQGSVKRMGECILEARKRVIAEELSLDIAKRYPTSKFFKNWQTDSLHRLDVQSNTYALGYEYLGKFYLALIRPETIQVDLDALGDVFRDSLFDYEVIDSNYEHVAGITNPSNQMILETGLGGYYSGWKIRLYYKDNDVFENAAKRTKLVYGWTAALVIGFMVLICCYAVKSVLHQAAINRLKNDFIATVTHELKTPLASMRVLADTLLEGNYKDQRQATEYLELICKENKRLTGLIDNFLTFSRMERNKQAFEFEASSPAEIANSAADAVRTKFEQAKCRLELDIAEDLPEVSVDKGAMVTVLVNLLDNACKYSYDEKKIAMKAFSEDGSVCFSVSDNGIGISRKAVKKIFKRFYQVDRSLARRAEGCGLGLSIAKFIVDAHKGEISVVSNPEQGSTFTVKLPTTG